ncbi:MAG: PDDEXK nuclease domain-containing protein [Saprospiraceae bacterium]
MSKTIQVSHDLVEQIKYWLKPLQYSKIKSFRVIKLEAFWQVGQLLHQKKIRPSHRRKLQTLSEELSSKLQRRITVTSLLEMYKFRKVFKEWDAIHSELSWSHYRQLISIRNKRKLDFYHKTTARNHWNSQQLKRQIEAHFYERSQQVKKKKTASLSAESIIKDMYILEFLDVANQKNYLEKELEDQLLQKLQFFLMELGEGYAFVARQKRIVTATGKQFFVDLVFYHFRMRCFVLFELKVGALSHRDIGQLDMYVRLFDEKWKSELDNPTVGIVLCSDKDPTLVKYSVLQDSRQLHAAKYCFNTRPTEIEERVQQTLERMFP